MSEEKPDKGVKYLKVALDLIEAVASAEKDVGVSELAQQLGLTKATVYRHLQTLLERNYIAQDARTSRYRLGVQCQLLAQTASGRIDLASASSEVAQALRAETGLSVVVSQIRARSVVVLSTILPVSPVQIGVRVGSELPLHSSAQGRIALAFGPASLLAAAKRNKRAATTQYTVTDWEALETKIAEAHEKGWADAPEELALGLNAVGAPIFNDSGECIGTIALVGLIQSLPRTLDPAITDAVKRAAERISSNLGFKPAALQSVAAAA